jgi:adenylosuccinate synthase
MTRKNFPPVYQIFKGWDADLRKVESFNELPEELLSYIQTIEKYTGVPIWIVSTGPDRLNTLF